MADSKDSVPKYESSGVRAAMGVGDRYTDFPDVRNCYLGILTSVKSYVNQMVSTALRDAGNKPDTVKALLNVISRSPEYGVLLTGFSAELIPYMDDMVKTYKKSGQLEAEIKKVYDANTNLGQQVTDLTTKAAAVYDREIKVAQREKILDANEADVHKRATDLAKRRKPAATNTDLDARVKELDARDHAITAAQGDLKNAQERLHDYEAGIKKREAVVQAREMNIDGIADKKKDIEAREAALQEREKDLETRAKQIALTEEGLTHATHMAVKKIDEDTKSRQNIDPASLEARAKELEVEDLRLQAFKANIDKHTMDYAADAKKLNEAKVAYEARLKDLEAREAKATEQLKEYDQGKTLLEEGFRELEDKSKQIDERERRAGDLIPHAINSAKAELYERVGEILSKLTAHQTSIAEDLKKVSELHDELKPDQVTVEVKSDTSIRDAPKQ